jgi:hypothetical protein
MVGIHSDNGAQGYAAKMVESLKPFDGHWSHEDDAIDSLDRS